MSRENVGNSCRNSYIRLFYVRNPCLFRLLHYALEGGQVLAEDEAALMSPSAFPQEGSEILTQ